MNQSDYAALRERVAEMAQSDPAAAREAAIEIKRAQALYWCGRDSERLRAVQHDLALLIAGRR